MKCRNCHCEHFFLTEVRKLKGGELRVFSCRNCGTERSERVFEEKPQPRLLQKRFRKGGS